MGMAGFALGWHSQGGRYEPFNVAIVTIWFAAIGFGFGNIFSTPGPKKLRLVFYWMFTLALIGMFFSPFLPFSELLKWLLAGIMGAGMGALIGVSQLKWGSVRP